ncbi:conserved protein of unknown function [Ectopseudomonas oleovorans]|uniref:Uncharacterized protein n=1 Tax=Ectopseudomonas oleovorans TaxID=301 RepID=A0A653AYZ4_ECTOL|nr:conserved protein of unknown function [Pseudomonas oleovorans]
MPALSQAPRRLAEWAWMYAQPPYGATLI